MQSHGLGPVSTRYEGSCEATPAPPFNLGRAYQFNGESCSVVVVMISGSASSESVYGNGMALMTALCFSSFAIVVRRNRNIEMMPALLISAVVIMAITLPMLWGDLAVPVHDLIWSVALGGFISALPNAVFIVASRHLVAAELTLFMLLEFALGPIWVWLISQ
jgi:drug/metabolite transporter (DMT)-like permease